MYRNQSFVQLSDTLRNKNIEKIVQRKRVHSELTKQESGTLVHAYVLCVYHRRARATRDHDASNDDDDDDDDK